MPLSRHFSPGIIDYNDVSTTYQSGRALSKEAATAWSGLVGLFLQGIRRPRLLDLGAGAGRFSVLFAQSLDARVVGVEPSAGMLAVASGHKDHNLAYVLGTAERIPLRDGTCDLAWLSQVWHHIRDRQTCVSELRRVLRSGRHVLLRGTFGDSLDGFPTLFHYWPAARGICEQLPDLRSAVGFFEANGFTLTEHRRVHQVTATSLGEFANRTKARADSALVLISDTEFHEGQTAIEAAAAIESTPVPVVEVIDLLAFQSQADHDRLTAREGPGDPPTPAFTT